MLRASEGSDDIPGIQWRATTLASGLMPSHAQKDVNLLLVKGTSINPLFGQIASLWGARNPHVPGRTFRKLRALPMLPNSAAHP